MVIDDRCVLALTLVVTALLTASLAGTARAADARITAEQRVSGRVIELTIATPAFSAPTKVDVNLPAGYDADASRRWPVTYFLAGTMNRYDAFNKLLDGEKLARDYPAIIVSPDARSGYWSDWYNGGAFGPPQYETFVISQLIPLIDARFRTRAERSRRAIFGVSMGGYGAMMLAARHPDTFAAAASLSGTVDTNLPAASAALSFSSTYDGAPADAIYGPRRAQEVRWRGHNPTDLAPNLRDLDLQVRAANGVPNLGIGEGLVDILSCAVEAPVHTASVNLHDRLRALGIAHAWKDYGAGCHSGPNFKREIVDTLAGFERVLANPPASPGTFDYRSTEPHFDIWGWHVDADPARALEFLHMQGARGGATLEGSGRTSVTTPAWYRGLKTVDVTGTATRPGRDGRLRFVVDLGPADTNQQFTPTVTPAVTSRQVALAPHAIVRITKLTRLTRGLRVCARAIGGEVRRARITAGGGSASARIGAGTSCHVVRLRRRPRTVSIRGRDRFGHRVAATARVRSRR